MRALLGRYRALALVPGSLPAVLPSLMARMPMGMTALAMLLLVRDERGSFAVAGAATGLFALAGGLAGPVRGRLVDRLGATPVLVATAIGQPVALIAVVVTAGRTPTAILLVAAVAAGALLPPVGPVMRALWRRLCAAAELRQAAFGLESVLVEVFSIAGPALVAALATTGSPALAMQAAAGLTLVGTLGVAAAPSIRTWPGSRAERHWLGPLVAPALRRLLAVVFVASVATGAAPVAVTAFAASAGAANLAGVLLAVLGVGSIAGGVFQGARRWRAPLPRQFSGWLAVLTAGFVPLILAPTPFVLGALLVPAGVAMAPTSAAELGLASQFAPEGTTTESFTWLSAVFLAGTAAGNAGAGYLAETAGYRAALALPAAFACLATLISLIGSSRTSAFQ